MFKVKCQKENNELVLKELLKEFTKMCIYGISEDFEDLDNEVIKEAESMISEECIEYYKDTEEGFDIQFICPNEAGFLLADLLNNENNYMDSFTSEDACFKKVVSNLLKQFPEIIIEGEIEYDDGISVATEKIKIKNNKVVSKWIEC